MSMSTSGGGNSVKAEPNVTPMIDVMLVLLIIFMVVTPALLAGFNAVPPQGQNLKDHPEDGGRAAPGSKPGDGPTGCAVESDRARGVSHGILDQLGKSGRRSPWVTAQGDL